MINQIMKLLISGKTYADRKGAAFGLAGMIKGLKIKSLKEYKIMDR